MAKAGKRCVESFVDVTWFSKNSQEGRRVRFLERARTDWGPEELWGGELTRLGETSEGGAGGWVEQFVAPTPQQILS